MSRKRKSFELGTTEQGKRLLLPNELATEAVAVFGRRGSGKSNTLTVCVEGLLSNGYQVVILDPKGEGWGLRRPGENHKTFPVVVLGEPHGDLPLDERHGATVADAVVDSGQSFVLSLAGFPSKSADRRFATAFFERLYRRKMQQLTKTPLTVVIEEAGLFIPQRIPKGGESLVGAIQQVVRQGRAFGLGVYLADQRPASVNTDIRTQMEVLICHQVSGSHDRKALREWVEAQADSDMLSEFLEHIAALRPGEAFIWSPSALRRFERVNVRRRWTYDSGATPTQQKSNPPGKASAIDMDQLRGRMQDAVEHAKANDPRELRKQVKDLTQKLKTAESRPAGGVDQKEVDRLLADALATRDQQWSDKVVSVTSDRMLELQASVEGSIKSMVQGVSTAADSVRGMKAKPNGRAITRVIPPKPKDTLSPPAALPPAPPVTPAPKNARPADIAARGELNKVEIKVLDAFAWWHSIGVHSATRAQVSLKSGYTNPGSSSFRKALHSLKDAGYLNDQFQALTHQGAAIASPPAAPSDIAEYHRLITQPLSAVESRAFEVLAKLTSYAGDKTTRQAVAEPLGYTNVGSSSFRKALLKMQTMGFVDLAHGGDVIVTSLIYPDSLT